MTQLDTHTVLEIIKMIDAKIANEMNSERDTALKHWVSVGRLACLEELYDHLQSFIEGQLNVAENNTGV